MTLFYIPRNKILTIGKTANKGYFIDFIKILFYLEQIIFFIIQSSN